MGKIKELSLEVRASIVAGYEAGVSLKKLAQKYNCHKNTVMYQIRKAKTQKCLRNVKGRGRKRTTTPKEDRRMTTLVQKNPLNTVKSVQSDINSVRKNKISIITVKRRLREANVKAFVVQKKPFINQNNKKNRLNFASTYLAKPVEFWRKVLWTDESCFSLDGSYGKRYFYSTPQQRKFRNITMPTRHSGGGKVMVWGCFSYNGVGDLTMLPGKVTSSTYLEILNEYAMVSGCKLIGTDFVLQQDNAPIHKSKMITKFLKDLDQETIDWPSQSPDLNPIENLWHYIKQKITTTIGRTPNETFDEIKRIWDEIPKQILENLVQSMPHRLQEVVDNNGGNTSY